MALVSEGFILTVSMVDNGRKSTKLVYNLTADTAADAATAATALIGDLNGVTDLAISGYNITERFIEDALTIPTALNAQRENRARIVLQLASSPLKKATIEIPGPADTVFAGSPGTSAYDVVDVADSLLNAYVENFEETTDVATLSDGEFIVGTNSIIAGSRVHKKTSLSNPG